MARPDSWMDACTGNHLVKRGQWFELDVDPSSSTYVLVHPGWTNDLESLTIAVREAGWFPTSKGAYEAAERAVLSWGWLGVDDSGEVRACSMDGTPEGDDSDSDPLQDVESATFAMIGTSDPLA